MGIAPPPPIHPPRISELLLYFSCQSVMMRAFFGFRSTVNIIIFHFKFQIKDGVAGKMLVK
jgi:hypothetical protein